MGICLSESYMFISQRSKNRKAAWHIGTCLQTHVCFQDCYQMLMSSARRRVDERILQVPKVGPLELRRWKMKMIGSDWSKKQRSSCRKFCYETLICGMSLTWVQRFITTWSPTLRRPCGFVTTA